MGCHGRDTVQDRLHAYSMHLLHMPSLGAYQHSIHKSSKSALICLDVDFRIVNLNKLSVGLEGGGDRSAILQAKMIKDHCDIAVL